MSFLLSINRALTAAGTAVRPDALEVNAAMCSEFAARAGGYGSTEDAMSE